MSDIRVSVQWKRSTVFAGEDVDFSWPGTEEQEWEITEDDTPELVACRYGTSLCQD